MLFDGRKNTFANLAGLPSNLEAIETGLLFSSGLVTFAAVVGPSGWGKTHLLDAIASRISVGGKRICPLALDTYLNHPSRYESNRVLILDDVQDVFGKSRKRQELRLHLERRVRAGRPTFLSFTGSKPSRQIKMLLPNSREWTVAGIAAPAPEERVPLLNHMAAADNMALSPQLVRIVAHRMHGNGRTLAGALKRLRLAGDRWDTPGETLRACGILDPFFSDSGEWDLKRKILKMAKQHAPRCGRADPLDLALHTMLNAGLCESEVARTAQVEPCEAYARSANFSRLIAKNADVAACSHHFIELVVCSLSHD